MSENKKYYYMKLKENFFTSERMVVVAARARWQTARVPCQI